MPNEPWQSPETQPTTEQTQPPVMPESQPVAPVAPVEEAMPVAEPVQPTQPVSEVPVQAPAADNVWVSKEEYERLRQAETAQQAAQPASKQKGPISGILIAALCLSALIFISSLISGHLTFFSAFGFALFALTGIFTMRDYLQAKQEGVVREHKARNVTLFVIALSIVVLPIVGVIAMFVLFFIACGTGGCRGS